MDPRFEELRVAHERAAQKLRRLLPLLTKFVEKHNFELADVCSSSYCFRIKFGDTTPDGVGWHAVSVSLVKMVEWRKRYPNTNVVEIALWNTTTGVTYDAAAGYDDVCLFDDMDKALEEVLRLYDMFCEVQTDSPDVLD